MSDKPLPETYWVLPGRFLAGGYPGSIIGDGQATRRRLAAFLEAGFGAFFDLTAPGELPAYLDELRAEAGRFGRPVDHRRFPVRDFGLPGRDEMAALLEAVDVALAQGSKVYLHCWGGVGRTGTAVGCWLARQGRSGEAALAGLEQLYRQSAQSLTHPHSPETDAQRAFVRNWDGA